MQQHINVICMNEPSSNEWANLICKLRWIGLEDEALRLEHAVSTYPQTNGARSRQDRSALTRAKASKARAFSSMTGESALSVFIRGDDLDVVLSAR
jgi:hypothetical protein